MQTEIIYKYLLCILLLIDIKEKPRSVRLVSIPAAWVKYEHKILEISAWEDTYLTAITCTCIGLFPSLTKCKLISLKFYKL